MARIIILQHSTHDGPGRLGATLRDHGFTLDIRRLDLTPDTAPIGTRTDVPTDLDNVHGVISLGGPQNVDESHPFLAAERALLKMAHDAQLPVVGICLGHQLLAEALGGTVAKMSSPEVGFVPVSLTIPAQTEPMLAGLAWTMPQFQSHAYEVTKLPPGATLLASSKACKIQCFRVGMRSFGFQFHFESDQSNIERRATQAGQLCALHGFEAKATSAQFTEHGEMFNRLADRLCVNLAALCFPMRSLTAV